MEMTRRDEPPDSAVDVVDVHVPFTSFNAPSHVPVEESEEDPVQLLDVTLLPVNYRKYTLAPLPYLLFGAMNISASLVLHPWLEHTQLAERMTAVDSVYRMHVQTGLFLYCRTLDYQKDWKCSEHPDSTGRHVFVVFLLCLSTLFVWISVILAVVQSGRTWLKETSEECQKNLPGIMLLELIAAILSFLAVLQIIIALVVFQVTHGGSASLGFFACEVGLISLFVGAILTWKVALEPTKNPVPWKIREGTQADDEESQDSSSSDIILYHVGAQ